MAFQASGMRRPARVELLCWSVSVSILGCTAGGARRAPVGRDAASSDHDVGAGADVPVVPVGPDAYRDWGRLPAVRIGVRTYMRSTYDRAGGNEAVDASHFLRQDAPDQNVTL